MKQKVNAIKEKNWEGTLVIVLLLIVLAILTPSLARIIYKSQVDGALSSAKGIVTAVETAYTEGNLLGVISLPFEVKYEDNNYITYSNGEEITIEKIRTEGRTPKSGSVIIDRTGSVVLRDLKFGFIACNKESKDSEITCEWSF